MAAPKAKAKTKAKAKAKPSTGGRKPPRTRKKASTGVGAAKKTVDLTQMAAEAEETISVEQAPPDVGGFFTVGRGVSGAHLAGSLRQLILLLGAGTPLMRSLTTVSERGESAGVRQVMADVAQHVESGNAFWQALERHPRHFGNMEVNLVKAGEASGTLTSVLERIVEYREKREMLNKQIRSAMLYPIVLLSVCVLVFILIAQVVVPQFEALFDKMDIEIGGISIWVIAIIKFLASLKFLIPLVLVLVVLFFVYKWAMTQAVLQRRLDYFKLRFIPRVSKQIVKKNAVAQMTRSLAMLLRSGLPMMATLDLARGAITNTVVADVLNKVRDSVEKGEGIEQPLRDVPKVIPPLVTDMLVTGEEAGQLDQIAEHIADQYEKEVELSISTIGDMMIPALTIFIGGMVLMLALALFLPMIELMQQIGAGAGA
jgi:type IV pilus assembly protein PilC